MDKNNMKDDEIIEPLNSIIKNPDDPTDYNYEADLDAFKKRFPALENQNDEKITIDDIIKDKPTIEDEININESLNINSSEDDIISDEQEEVLNTVLNFAPDDNIEEENKHEINTESLKNTAQPINNEMANKIKNKKEEKSVNILPALIILFCLCSLLSALAGMFIGANYFSKKATTVYRSQELTQEETHNITLEDLQKATVQINITITGKNVFGQIYETVGFGSGVLISEEGHILTNAHIIKDATTINVVDYFNNKYEAVLIGTDEKSDIGVIKIKNTKLKPVTIGDSDSIVVGNEIYAIGNPLGIFTSSISKGIISCTGRDLEINNQYMNLIQIDAPLNNGNSGGGLFNNKGELIGITNIKYSGLLNNGATIDGISFAVPINQAMTVADQLIQFGYVKYRATLGVSLYEIDENPVYAAGLYISEIIPDKAADKAGLKEQDRIIEFNGKKIKSYTDIIKELNTLNVGDTVKIKVVRYDEEMEFDITLSDSSNITS